MWPYAELPGRRTRQIIADITMGSWIILWIWIAVTVYTAIDSLSAITDKVASTGGELEQSLNNAAEEANKIPLVGDGLGQQIANAAHAAGSVADTGANGSEKIGHIALLLAVVLAFGAIVPPLVIWLWMRLRWAMRARVARLLRDTPENGEGMDLLALRAVTNSPLSVLRAVDVDPAGGWRVKNPATIAALAGLELRALGLRPPPGPMEELSAPAGDGPWENDLP